MKTEFLKRLGDVVKEAQDLLNSLAEGRKIELVTDKELEEDEDALYDLPFASRVGKYGEYDEFGVISVEKREGKIIFNLLGRGEASGEQIKTYLTDGFYDISDESFCELVDRISEQL